LQNADAHDHLRRTRPRIERLIGLLANRYGARKNRYLGSPKGRLQASWAAALVNLNPISRRLAAQTRITAPVGARRAGMASLATLPLSGLDGYPGLRRRAARAPPNHEHDFFRGHLGPTSGSPRSRTAHDRVSR
jgi:hypothetical protein